MDDRLLKLDIAYGNLQVAMNNFYEHLDAIHDEVATMNTILAHDIATERLLVRNSAKNLKLDIEDLISLVSVLKGINRIKGRTDL